MSDEKKKDSSESKPRILSKHKETGKHSLKYDSIFKGKKDDILEEDYTGGYFNSEFTYDPQSAYYDETQNNEEYSRDKNLKEKVYNVLIEYTDINFMSNRRKPSRVDFNNYYNLLVEKLENDNFSNVQLFNELAYYFSDNLFNMFKLLDSKWRNKVIDELQEHIGKAPSTSKEIRARNLTIGSEIEFEIEIEEDEEKMVTGIIIDTNHEDGEYEVNSFENVYIVPIECITKILNNQKFKYNLNKLNNLDIL